MRLAFLGEIHGNLPALEAVLQDLHTKPVDLILHVGNLVGYGPFPGEVMELLQKLGISGVRGNHDERVSGMDVPVGGAENDTEEIARLTCGWARERLTPDQRARLADLPSTAIVDSGRMQILVSNSSPIEPMQTPHMGRSDDFYRDMGDSFGVDVHVFACSRVPFYRVVDSRWYVNVGSVGASADGDPRAAYVLLEINGGAAVRINRVEYHRDRTRTAIQTAGLPAGAARVLGVA